MALTNVMIIDVYVGEEIEAFLNKYKKKSMNTYKAYRSALNQIFKDLFKQNEYKYITKNQVESLTLKVLTEYFDELSNMMNENDEYKYKNATINSRISVIKEFLKYMYTWDVIKYDIPKLDSLELYPDTREEIEMIPYELAVSYMDFFAKEDQGLEKSLIVKLAVESALRAQELLGLDWDNFIVEEDGVIIKSHGYKKGKGNKEFLDKIDRKLHEELLQLKSLGNSHKLFNLTYKQLSGMMDRANAALNNTGISYTFHSFKKLAVTMCYLNSNNCIHTAQKKARHSNVNTTMRYLRLTDLNVTGIISAKMNTEDEIYKTVSHEELLEALSEMRPEMLLLLNNKLKNRQNK